jgi:peptidyl-prolyl cis-trans isomerase SurA
MTRPIRLLVSSCAFLLPSVALLVSPLGECASLAEEAQVLSGLAAVVNQDPITFGQVRELVGAQEEAAKRNFKGAQLIEEIKRIRLAALNELIDRQLILQEFKKMEKEKGVAIPQHVIDEHIETIIREQFGNDRQAFIRTLAASGLSLEKFKEMEREKIIISAMRSQALKNNSGGLISGIVAEPRIREYYEKNKELYTSEEQMHLRMLVLRKTVGEGNPRRKMMEEIREKVIAGAAFADLARMYDEGSTDQSNRGDWGWISRRTLNETLTREAFKLKPGQLSHIIDIDGNYYLLYCEARKPQVCKPLKEVHDEIEKKLLQEDRQKVQQQWLAKLRSKAYVKLF